MRKIQFVFLASLWLFSCGNSTDQDPLPTAGVITGSVLLFDEGSTSVSPAGMRVSIDNLNPSRSGLTDNFGKFTLENVPFGTYNLRYEKEDYGVFQKIEVVHQSSITPLNVTPSLGKLSSTQITEVRMEKSGSSLITYVTTNPAGTSNNRRYIRYFFSTSPDVSSSNYTSFSETYVVQDSPYYKSFTTQELAQIGINPTGTIYMRVYGDSFFSNQYIDPTTKKTVFPNLNSSTVASKSVSF